MGKAKRGASGLSFVVGIDKPAGMSSHDVVNRCRRIFGERRVGHTGTLDPLASGALMICVGPATRLDAYLQTDTKEYDARIVFGSATDTDDAAGTVIRTAPVPAELFDESFASRKIAALVGNHNQIPPLYSAIKVDGVKGYEAARQGRVIELAPRAIAVLSSAFLAMGLADDGSLFWDAHFAVSKGTYIRSLARDLGRSLSTEAHLGALRRTRCGGLSLDDCVSLDALEENPRIGWLDPVSLLGRRVLFADAVQAKAVANGGFLLLPAPRIHGGRASLYSVDESRPLAQDGGCLCVAHVHPDLRPPEQGEIISVVSDNKLVALYAYESERSALRPRCVFSQGVSRGSDI
ncbi:MAG: tRNA pseudouridine(55) synthase TruB [Eggerthellaceae bacterium]|jgi:tRNA pseudouridine55 synthase